MYIPASFSSKWKLTTSFNRYAAIAGRILRQALKEDKRAAAARKDTLEVRYAKWDNGKQSEPEPLNLTASK